MACVPGDPRRSQVGEARDLAGDCVETITPKTQARLLAAGPADFAALWPHVDDEAESLTHEAQQKLAARSVVEAEAEALREILELQRADIAGNIDDPQLDIAQTFTEAEPAQAEQLPR